MTESLEPILKLVYQEALNEQLRREPVFHGRLTQPTPEELLEIRHKREAERKALLDLLATATGTVKAIVELHSPTTYDECEGCDFGGWEGDSPAWPCRTIELIVKELKSDPST